MYGLLISSQRPISGTGNPSRRSFVCLIQPQIARTVMAFPRFPSSRRPGQLGIPISRPFVSTVRAILAPCAAMSLRDFSLLGHISRAPAAEHGTSHPGSYGTPVLVGFAHTDVTMGTARTSPVPPWLCGTEAVEPRQDRLCWLDVHSQRFQPP